MKSIGGYFSLELPHNTFGELYPYALCLNAGRYCLEYILRARRYRKVYIPYYTCEAVLQPIKALGLDYEFYHIDKDFHIVGNIKVGREEALLYTNYFGLMESYANEVAYEYSPNVIIDNTQAFFSKPREHTDTFNTCRKFFGVADGAYLFTDARLDMDIPQDHSTARMKAVLDRLDKSPEEAFQEYHESEASLDDSGMRRMSKLTQSIMDSIDYNDVANRRLRNYHMLDKDLADSNEMHFALNYGTIPMVYPYYCHKKGLRQHLINKKVYVAKYWNNVIDWAGKDSLEADLTEHLIPLPIDQRYGKEEMEYIINIVKSYNG